MSKRILVSGAGGNAAMNFIASLRMADEPFTIVGTDMNPWHLRHAAVDRRYLVPGAHSPEFLEKLCRVIEREGVEFVHPQPDIEVEFLANHRDQVPARLLLPDAATVAICLDKMETNRCLARAGVPVPSSRAVSAPADIPGLMQEVMNSQAVVWVRALRGAGSRAALPVRTARQAEDWIHYWESVKNQQATDFMLCEFLPGREFAYQSLWQDGRLVTSMARERLEYLFGNQMPSGQSSTPAVARTVHDERVNQTAAAAVRAVAPRATGVFCVDLKENAHGVPCVTEINVGRFFTTNNFFTAAGLNMPYYYVRMAYGEPLPDLPPTNAVDEGLYWIRAVDHPPLLVKGEDWGFHEI